MPRSTGGGGGRSTGSSHRPSSRSSGSSHRASSSRGSPSAGRSSYGSSSRRTSSGPGFRPTPPVFVPYSGAGMSRPLRRSGSGVGGIVAVIVVLCAIAAVMFAARPSDGIPASTAAREKLDLGYAFDADCVRDDIGWIDDESGLSGKLKEFYRKTGCQPYVYMKAYDPAVSSDAELDAWIQQYYDTTFADRQDAVLYVYACEAPDPADDRGNGWQSLQVGTQSSLVMDAEAMDIFWAYVDADWSTWDPNDNDGMFADIFNRTAARVMQKTTTGKDLVKAGLAVAAIAVAIGGVIAVMVIRRRHEAQRAAETEAILSAPIERAGTAADELARRYGGQDGDTGS